MVNVAELLGHIRRYPASGLDPITIGHRMRWASDGIAQLEVDLAAIGSSCRELTDEIAGQLDTLRAEVELLTTLTNPTGRLHCGS